MYIILPYNPHLFTSLDTHLFSFPWLRNQFNYLMPHILFILHDCHIKWALKLSMRFIHSSSYAKFASLPRDTCRTDEGRRMWSAWAWQHVLPLNCHTTESKKKLTFALSVHPALFSRPFPPSTLLSLALGSLRFRTNHNSIVSTCQSQDMGLHLSSVTLALYNHLWSRVPHFPPPLTLSHWIQSS